MADDIGRDRFVVAPDTPGFGMSDPPPGPREIGDFADVMHDFIAEIGLGMVDVMGYHTGSLTGAAAAQAPQLIFNDRLDAALTLFFLVTVWVLLFETARICYASLTGKRCPPLAESPHVATQLARDAQ